MLSRLAIIHLVAEARGLDVNPMTIEKFRKNKDFESVKVLETIHNDEITRWYHRSGGRCDSLSDYFVNRRDDRAQMVLLDVSCEYVILTMSGALNLRLQM